MSEGAKGEARRAEAERMARGMEFRKDFFFFFFCV